MNPELKFLNDIVQPWDELNALLVERYAFQPDLSAVTRLVTAISTAIKHQVDILAIDKECASQNLQEEVDAESEVARLISDVSDAAKHVVLRNPKRQNSVFVAAMFEANKQGEFRFIRNGVFVEHAILGRQDFMCATLSAIKYWSQKRNLTIGWDGTIREASGDFFPTAFLHFNPKYCINMASTRIMIFRRDDTGNLTPFDGGEIRFEVY